MKRPFGDVRRRRRRTPNLLGGCRRLSFRLPEGGIGRSVGGLLRSVRAPLCPCSQRGGRPPGHDVVGRAPRSPGVGGGWSRHPRRGCGGSARGTLGQVGGTIGTGECLPGAYEEFEPLPIPSSVVVGGMDGAYAGAESGDQFLDARGLIEAEHGEVVDAASEVVFVGGAFRTDESDGSEN